jgi:thiamine biosynthesis protein ThiI
MQEIDSVLVRFGEIGIKSDRVRSRYERRLVTNIERALKFCEIPYDSIVRDFGRIFVRTKAAAAAPTVARVFGVVSVSPAQTSSATLDALSEAALRIMSPLLTPAKSFGISARRTGTHTYSSKDISIVVGDAIKKATGAPVRLTNPDARLFIEVRSQTAYLYTDILPGVGGLPLGTQGKMVALLSGGIDSPVAAWLMMKRGCTIIPLFLDCKPFVDPAGRERVTNISKALAVWAGHPLDLAVVLHGESLDKFKKLAPRMTCLLCKRLMYKIAARVAKKEQAHGIVTGESIGQVASQTSQNLLAIDDACDVPIFRPLIGFDKTETIALARRIGTYNLSTEGALANCSAAHRHPTTNANLDEIKGLEAELLTSELTTVELESLSWEHIFPEKSFRFALCPEQRQQG